MKITVTLSEALDRCHDWEAFCKEFGWGEWAVNEGGGLTEQDLTLEQAQRHGLVPKEQP